MTLRATAGSAPDSTTDATRRGPDLVPLLLAAVVVSMAVLRGTKLWSARSGEEDPLRSVSLELFDLPLAALVLIVLGRAVAGRELPKVPRTALGITAAASGAWVLVTLAVQPSWRGLDWALHVLGAVVIAWVIGTGGRRAVQPVIAVFVAFAVAQGLFGVVQSLYGSTLGWTLVEYSQDLLTFGSQVGGKGSFGHPYHLATLLVVGVAGVYAMWPRLDDRWRPWALAAVLLLGFSLPFTFSRAAILSMVPIVLLGLVPRRWNRRLTIALAAGATIGALVTAPGWTAKAERSLDRDRVDSGRIELAEDAWSLMSGEPLFGIGPGRYVVELSEQRGVVSNPAHNAVLHAGAEMGAPGFVLAAALLVVSGWWAVRRGALTTIVWLAPVPLFLLDAFPYVFPRGIVICGFWAGLTIRTVSARD